MAQHHRREFLKCVVSAATSHGWMSQPARGTEGPAAGGGLSLASFRFDVTPPLGHSCCGGWIRPVEAVDDPLEAIGLVLRGAGPPVVLCAVDWTGLGNEAHVEWRRALASAAGTTPDRVAVHCVHQHNAPLACLEAERLVKSQGDLPHIVDEAFFRACLDRGRDAIAAALRIARPVTHVACGQAQVEKVASNRRISRGPDGRVLASRGSSCPNPELRALPEGVIDPWLKTVAFFDGRKKIAACHYYATHPMSYYGDGRVSSDFAGLARKQRQQDEPECCHIYFTGCSGNVTAGKYNDGAHEMRAVLVRRVYEGLLASEKDLRPAPIAQAAWKTVEVLPPPRADLAADKLLAQISDKQGPVVSRNRPAYMLAWLRRLERRIPLVVSALRINDTHLLHLPGECFVEYQLRAQQIQPARFVATAAYGDAGCWYIPTREEYPPGGYEVSVAFCDPQIDTLLTQAVRTLLA